MDAQKYVSLFETIQTRQEVDSLRESLDALLSSFYQTKNSPLPERIQAVASPEIVSVITKAFERAHLSIEDHNGIKAYCTDLLHNLESLPVITLTVAITPDKSVLKELVVSLRDRLHIDHLVLDIQIDPQLLGGAQVIWKGAYLDFSLKKQIEEWFEKRVTHKV